MTEFEWLAQKGWRVAAPGEFDFGAPEAEAAAALRETVLVPLAHLGCIRAAGSDCDSFLQSQLSNDLRELTATRAQLSSYNSPKGRVLDLFVLRREAGTAMLETRRDTLPATLKRLRLFVLRSKITLEERGAASALGLAGPQAAELLSRAGLPVPQQDWECAAADTITVMRRPGSVPRFSLHADAAVMPGLWNKLAAEVRPAGTAAWRLLDVLAGLPAIHPETADHFVAQMLNLDRLGGISFSKGCYPGQEIVARMHYLGNLKRRMFLGFADAAASPAAAVYADGEPQAVGEVVQSAPHPQRGTALLLVLQLGHAAAELRLGAVDGPALAVQPLAGEA